MRTKSICFILLLGILCVTARSNRKGFKRSHKKPLYRSIEDITTTADEIVPKLTAKTKLILIKARSSDGNEGRFLKHILLLKQFMQPQNNGYNNYPNNNYNNNNGIPYIFINNPTNLTNVNNNTLTNVPAPATATATAAGTGTGTGAAVGGVRYTYLSNSQALPYALPMPTQVYQQRQQAVPQVVYGTPINTVNFQQPPRNRNRNGNGNGNRYPNPNFSGNYDIRPSNPFSTFTNNLKRITFL